MSLSPIAILALIYTTASFLLRALLWWTFGREAGVLPLELPKIFALGVLNDIFQLLYLTLPLTLLLIAIPPRWRKTSIFLRSCAVGFALILFGLLYLQAVEYFFFDEFDARFNLIAVDYLMYPHEVFVNLWESYPVMWFLLGAALLTALLFWLLWGPLKRALLRCECACRPWRRAGLHVSLVACTALFLSTDSFLSSANRVSNEIAANGISSFFRALRTDDIDYHLYYSTMPREQAYQLMRQHLASQGGTLVSDDPSNLSRTFPDNPKGLGKLNVVILSEESLGAGFIGAYGDQRGLSPNFDRLSKQGLLFKNAYATGTRTVRGLEALSTSFPPIPSESILKRPGNENVANWGEVFKQHGYHTSFLYGGFGLFDNMNYFFGHNGFELSDRADIKDPNFANIWGVSDQDLFRHAMSYFDQVSASGKPFFSIIMTTSNHKPYTFPAGIPGVPESGGGRDAGVRYADYAIGKFFEQAPSHAWYKNTLFIVVADHDARVYGRSFVPIERYRIPLLMLAPGKIAEREEQIRISQIDLLPTVMGLLGLGYSGPFYGSDVLAPQASHDRPILVSHNHSVAIFDGRELSVLGLQKSEATFAFDPSNNSQQQIAPNQTALQLATAYFQTAAELFKQKGYRLAE